MGKILVAKETSVPTVKVQHLTFMAKVQDDLPVSKFPAEITAFTDKLMGEMCEQFTKGASLEDVALLNGLDPKRFYALYAGNHFGLRTSFDRAMAQCKFHHLQKVHNGSINFQSSTWFLERKFKAEYAKESTVKVSTPTPSHPEEWQIGAKKLSF